MNKRDKQIINHLHQFRVMSRDDIIDLHFSHLKNPITNANTVLKRLVRDKQIEASRSYNPYVYFPAESTMKKNSTKIPHFLAIVGVYKQLKEHIEPQKFVVEPKFQKGLAEPDVLTIIKGKPFFIELQRNVYSQKVMDKKMKRYEDLYYSGELDSKPFIIMISDTRYEINSDMLTVFQVESIHEFMNNVKQREQTGIKKASDVKVKIG